MEDMAKKVVKKKITTIILTSLAGIAPFLLGFFVIIVTVFIVLDLFTFDSSASNSSVGHVTTESGFTISKTSLSKSEYKEKLEKFAESNPKFEIFAENADAIYEYSVSKNVNPELVPVRAYVEGRGSTTGTYNYWGMGCTNTGGLAACFNYDSFEAGYTDYVNNVSQYDSLADMMSRYAYIGEYWYNPGGSDIGGCYYAPYIYDASSMPSRVARACAKKAPACSPDNTQNCVKTTDEDQNAYARWQVEQNMSYARELIFGLKFNEGPTVNTYDGTINYLSTYNLKGNGLTVLNRTLTTNEIAELNKYIDSEVDKAGYGTGAGVAAAGQALAYWLEQKGYYISYYWGGGHMGSLDAEGTFLGVNPNWGTDQVATDRFGNKYYGLDCSGFVSWTIREACSPYYGTKGSGSMEHGPEITISEAKPGDLMVKTDGDHVRLIVKNNNDGSVITVESVGLHNDDSGVWFTKKTASTEYKIIDMTEYYKKGCQSERISQ